MLLKLPANAWLTVTVAVFGCSSVVWGCGISADQLANHVDCCNDCWKL